MKWHLAHTTWFFETFVLARVPGSRAPSEPAFRALFNSYYASVGAGFDRPRRGLLTRPSLAEVRAYRDRVDDEVLRLLERGSLDPEIAWRIELGWNHEEQHQELILTDVKHLLAQNPLNPAFRPAEPRAPRAASSLAWRPFDAGLVEIGHAGEGFAFDNESPRHRVWIEAFEIASRPSTNAEYLAFVEDRGYERPEFWLASGLEHARAEGWRAPLHWRRIDGRWFEFTLHGLESLDLEAPVCHLSGFEADAFARWSGARLPTEFEWEHAARSVAVEGRFADCGRLHPEAAASSDGGLSQLFGDVWEWTSSDYAPYPGFRPWTGEIGEYNGKFMCNQRVLRGGSCATPRGHARASYRNFFPLEARWQFSGVRLARYPHAR